MIIHLFTFIALLPCCTSYYFTSVHKTRELVDVERRLLYELGKYIEDAVQENEIVSDEIKTFYERALVQNQKAITSPGFLDNPLNSFHFLKRMYKGWSRLFSIVSCDDCGDHKALTNFNNQINAAEEAMDGDLATLEGDFNGAIIGILRLQGTYKLDVRNLIQGRVLDEVSEPLSVDDVLAICRILDERDDFDEEIHWLEELLSVQMEHSSLGELTRVVRAMASVLWKTGRHQRALSLLREQQENDPSDKKLAQDLEYYTDKYSSSQTSDDREESELLLEEDPPNTFELLCMGKGKRNITILSQLKCIYRRTAVPIYMAKEEILSIVPRVSLVYNVIYESEQIAIKDFAATRLMDSTVMNTDGSSQLDTSVRVSQTTWLKDSDLPVIDRVSRRVELITGLSTSTVGELPHAEQLQVLNYGLGGMYVPHLDAINVTMLPGSRDMCGDRLATWMFYLNDVKAGGATVFPNLNITVPVKKGAAAFWYNLKRNGKKDVRLRHAGCPVLIGSKWVANKWIRETGQIFRRKCGLSVNSIDGLADSPVRCF